MSETPDVEISEEEISGDSATVIVTDVEDYGKTEKLKSIQECKEHYRSFTTKRNRKMSNMDNYRFPSDVIELQEAEALAIYASELLPLIDRAIEKGTLSEEELKLKTDTSVRESTGRKEVSIRNVVDNLARVPGSDGPEPLQKPFQLKIYRRLEHIESKLGLGIQLEEDKGPAEI